MLIIANGDETGRLVGETDVLVGKTGRELVGENGRRKGYLAVVIVVTSTRKILLASGAPCTACFDFPW